MTSMDFLAGVDLERVFAHRSEVPYWRGRLTRDEYLERTRRIFVGHPYGRERIRTLALRDEASGELVCSMDLLDVEFLLSGRRDARLERARLPLITSLVTPAVHRKQGLAAKLLARFHESENASLFFLYSDIAPAFYEAQGYVASPMLELLTPARRGGDPTDARPLSPAALIEGARAECAERLSANEGKAVCLPDELFLDWHLERYRFFAQLRGRSLPEELCWSLDHGGAALHMLCAAPDFVELQLDALWLRAECIRCVEFAAARAAALGLESLRYWAPPSAARSGDARVSDHGCVPMLRAAIGNPAPVLVTPNICTWF